ncbi:MAG: SAM hydrolase/SAM-dependent halogenase family protein [Ktedonobacterales bacterium]
MTHSLPVPNVTSPLIAMLTDFGTADGYPGVMKGVILGIAPGTQIVDLTHDIPPQDVATAAWVLQTAWRYFPAGTIFLCVVDPGVGSDRRPVALRLGEHIFVGPDNGLFSYALAAAQDQQRVSPVQAVTLDNPRYRLPHVSATFHGRDIFAPAAAHLARGVPFASLGTPLDPTSLVTIAPPRPTWQGETLIGHILHIDHFGNLITDIGPTLTAAAFSSPTLSLHLGEHIITARAHTFADGPAGAPFALRDSSGHLAVVVRNGSAGALLDAHRGDELRVTGIQPIASD